MQRVAGKQLFHSDVSVLGSFGPMRRMRPVRGEPAMVMSDQQARLSGRKSRMPALERSVVDDLWDLLSEPNPLPEIKASVATALTPYIDRPGD